MVVARGGLSANSWPDVALSFCLLTLGASADELFGYGAPLSEGDMMIGCPNTSYIIPSQNNLTENERVENTGDAERTPFVWSFPHNRSDFMSRARESQIGFMVSGRDIVYVEGRAYIRGWEPRYGQLTGEPFNPF